MTLGVSDLIRVTWEFAMPDSVTAFMVRHYLATQGTGAAEATVLTDIATWVEAGFELQDSIFSDHVSMVEATLYLYDYVNHRFDGLVAQALSAFVGSDVGSYMPQGNAALVKLFTDVARRQSRVYIPGLTEGEITDGDWSAAAITALAAIAGRLNDILVSDGVTFQPVTFNVDSTSPLYETTGTLQNTLAVSTDSSYQRRRKPGVGI